MKSPSSATILACRLAVIRPLPPGEYDGPHAARCLATLSTRVASIASAVRKLVEHGCNVELSARQRKRLDSLRKRADDLLHPYGLKLDNPWGLCHYACPIDGGDRLSESDCIFLA